MALTFEEQNIIDHGVGEYHINHFIGYFDGSSLDHYQFSNNMVFPLDRYYANRVGVGNRRLPAPQAVNADDVTLHLHEILPSVFNPNSTAVLHKTNATFRQTPAVRFAATAFTVSTGIGGTTVNMPHEDWVTLKEDTAHPHLFGTTLRRVERNVDDVFVEVLPWLPLLSTPFTGIGGWVGTGGLHAVTPSDNRRHFLAGRRTWRCGFDASLGLHYFETAAFERFSDSAYVRLQSALRPMVDTCWIETIVNFSRLLGAPLVTPSTPPASYQTGSIGGNPARNIAPFGPVYFRNASFSAANKSAAETAYNNINWFAPLVARMPSLSTAQMPGF